MRGPEKLEGQFQSPCRFPDLRPGAPSSISPRSVGHRTRPFWHSVFLSSYMDLLANEQINYLKSISMLSCFSEPLQSVHDGSTKSCFRNTMARYDFTFFFIEDLCLSWLTDYCCCSVMKEMSPAGKTQTRWAKTACSNTTLLLYIYSGKE